MKLIASYHTSKKPDNIAIIDKKLTGQLTMSGGAPTVTKNPFGFLLRLARTGTSASWPPYLPPRFGSSARYRSANRRDWRAVVGLFGDRCCAGLVYKGRFLMELSASTALLSVSL